jgi:hypothetical protein
MRRRRWATARACTHAVGTDTPQGGVARPCEALARWAEGGGARWPHREGKEWLGRAGERGAFRGWAEGGRLGGPPGGKQESKGLGVSIFLFALNSY